MSDDTRQAQFAFLTEPQPGKAVLNVQVQGEEILRFALTRDHLFRINAASADALLHYQRAKTDA